MKTLAHTPRPSDQQIAAARALLVDDLEQLAQQIICAHGEQEKLRDLAIVSDRAAAQAAIQCGELLIKAREMAKREFVAWLEMMSETREEFPSLATAYRYIRAVKYKASLGDESPDFSSLKELYIAAGILPPSSTSEPNEPRTSAPLFRIKLDLNGPAPDKWKPLDRREFLEQAKPIVELYNRVREIEDAA